MKQEKEHIAFKEMLRRCDSTIFRVCLMFAPPSGRPHHAGRDPQKMKDLYQDIVCALWESWPRFRRESSENTWVYRIALNIALSQMRHRSFSRMFIAFDDEAFNNLADESKDEMVEKLYELVDLLSDDEKALLILYLDGVNARDMGATLGISEAAVNHRIERIKKKLITLNEKYNE